MCNISISVNPDISILKLELKNTTTKKNDTYGILLCQQKILNVSSARSTNTCWSWWKMLHNLRNVSTIGHTHALQAFCIFLFYDSNLNDDSSDSVTQTHNCPFYKSKLVSHYKVFTDKFVLLKTETGLIRRHLESYIILSWHHPQTKSGKKARKKNNNAKLTLLLLNPARICRSTVLASVSLDGSNWKRVIKMT